MDWRVSDFLRQPLSQQESGKGLGSGERGRMPHLLRLCPVLHLLCARLAVSQEAPAPLMLMLLLLVMLVGLKVSWSLRNNVRTLVQKTKRSRA